MRKIFAFLFLVLVAQGCSRTREEDSWMAPSDKLHVLCTTVQVGELVQFLGKDRVATAILLRGELDPHSYELVKGDGEKFLRADAIVYSGLGLEHGASLFALLQDRKKAFPVGDAIAKRVPEKMLLRGDVIDPHLWMDVALWKEGVDPLVEFLSQKDPDGAEYYRERGALLSRTMEETHEKLLAMLRQVPPKRRYLITSHDAFRYFVRAYFVSLTNWEEHLAAPEGLAPDGQINPLDLQKIIHFVIEHQVGVLFPESNVSPASIQKIAAAGGEMGVEVRVCGEPLYGDAMGAEGYLSSMEKNGDILRRNL